jgi:Xaa-Pro dipeptidase
MTRQTPLNPFGREMTASPGTQMAVDFEDRVDVVRLRRERLQKAKDSLRASGLGGLLLFDQNNIRYVTGTHIGEWARDKMARYVFLPADGDPILWDFGSAAASHRRYASWLPESSWRAGVASMRGALPTETGIAEAMGKRIHEVMSEHGVAGQRLGVDILDVPILRALESNGVVVEDGQRVMLGARRRKTVDEIAFLDHAAGMVDAVYDHIYREWLRPGVRENDLVAEANRLLYSLGSDEVEAINAVSGERTSPHPHVFADRLIRPGDTAYFDIIQAYNGYRTCYYRTFSVGFASPAQLDAYKQCRDWIDRALELVKPGQTTDRIALVWPAATDFGFSSEEECFGLQFGHGVGLALWEPPIISRLNSLDHPMELEEGMVIALETFCPAKDGMSAARIEEEVVVTKGGCEVITRFPASDALIAAQY